MKFTLSWLKDYLDTTATLDEIAVALNNLGLEVEQVYNPEKTLGEFTVGHILEAQQHPDADKLRICKVDTHQGITQIICGASNARAGIKVCVSLPGMYIPGLDITIKKGKIRGVESHGMLCSLEELGLEESCEGILELPEEAKVGTRVIDILGFNDPMIEIAITPNRPDALGVYGVARDLAAYGLGKLKPLEIPEIKGEFKSPISFEVTHSESCPHFVGYYIKNIENKPSPDYIQKRLKAIGMTPKSSLVDITNYLSFTFARPLHVFDADKIGTKMQARLAKSGEEIKSLKEIDYKLEEKDIVIADENKAHAIAGIMGGFESGCSLETKNVFIESAYFNPHYIAMTGRRLGILSDARYRFERGIDPEFTKNGAKFAANMVLALCGGQASEIVEAGEEIKVEEAFSLAEGDVKNLTSVDVSWEKQKEILGSLGFKIIEQGKKLIAIPPSYRPDIKGKADLIEEIIRIYGIDNVPMIALPLPKDEKIEILSPLLKRIMTLRKNAVLRGLNEAVSYSFVSQAQAKSFNGGSDALRLVNPIVSYLSDMRPSILPSLLTALQKNRSHNLKNQNLFEIGRVFHGLTPEEQKYNLALIRTGDNHDKHWSKNEVTFDIYDIKADMVALLESIGVPVSGLQIKRDVPSYYHPARSAALYLGKTLYGYFGEIHPKVLKSFDISDAVMASEIFLEDIAPAKEKKGTSLPNLHLCNLHSIQRDFAFVVDETIEAEMLLRCVRKAEKKLLSEAEIFDIYRGASIGEGKKSVALRVVLQPQEQSLTDNEIEAISQNIITEVSKGVGGYLRS